MDAREATRLASSEPPGMMAGPNTYGMSLHTTSMLNPSSAGIMQNLRLPYNQVVTPASRPSDPSNSGGYHTEGLRPSGFTVNEPVKKKRGRPRKYGPDGSMALGLVPLSSVDGGHSNNNDNNNENNDNNHPNESSTPSSEPPYKRNRGRPLGSGKKQQQDALGAPGVGFTTHVITVKAGEDVASKIVAFSQQGSRTVCIISANGAICNVTLRQPATSGGTVTYEGRFEIISLSGSFLFTENGGSRIRTGGLSVALAGSDGRVLGGGVAGMLMAAGPVQVIVGSFIADGKKSKSERRLSLPAPQTVGLGAPVATGSPPFQGASSESSGQPDSPLNHSSGACNNTGQIQGFSSYSSIPWGSHSANPH
ncbi:AT-hook motif nuclear-localized protein 10-like [Macadamia integrifolia]|uniref:AT-hook motif nuclear-localized protein 10-like n=1 Tax=Macadamia integrifolia TaxID=60698 RepID=UPI001C50173C|nr:AT-hook motif nuclear-localized protein 10-like [Macadamia integrifolia]XP_042494179.1 AT-hook motif nuclear-localized protein 10-like [Macadamia integrifolia]